LSSPSVFIFSFSLVDIAPWLPWPLTLYITRLHIYFISPFLSWWLQGGFARCFAFTNPDKGNKVVAGKVVDKMSLAKNKAKQKVSWRWWKAACLSWLPLLSQ
jgi:hypothetical protein